jgi:hypothetical protein
MSQHVAPIQPYSTDRNHVRPTQNVAASDLMIIERLCPEFDARRIEQRKIRGDIATVYEAVLTADFIEAWKKNPVVRLLFALRAYGERLVSAVRGRTPTAPEEVSSLRLADMTTHGEWVLLGKDPPREVAFGVVGRFWTGETSWEQIEASEFASFTRPGFAKIACNFSLRPSGEDETLVSYEARTKATDPDSRRSLLRYWRPLSPFIGIVMRSQLSVVENEAERRVSARGQLGNDERVGERPTPLAALRAFGVTLGAPFALSLMGGASLATATHAVARRRRPHPLAAAGTAAVALYALKIRPWLLNWGSTPDERKKTMPEDELMPEGNRGLTRAVTIDAPIEEVWPWLAQLGQDRGGFYSYQWLENLAGCRMQNADRIHPEWQHREVGETVLLHPANGLKLMKFEPNRAFALEEWGAFVLEPLDTRRTRLIARNRRRHGLHSFAYACLLEIPHFIMERKMLLGIKARAERRYPRTS